MTSGMASNATDDKIWQLAEASTKKLAKQPMISYFESCFDPALDPYPAAEPIIYLLSTDGRIVERRILPTRLDMLELIARYMGTFDEL